METSYKQALEVEVGDRVRYRHYTWEVRGVRRTRSETHLELQRYHPRGGWQRVEASYPHGKRVGVAPEGDWG